MTDKLKQSKTKFNVLVEKPGLSTKTSTCSTMHFSSRLSSISDRRVQGVVNTMA